jgi:peptide/nickel transport system permease protein
MSFPPVLFAILLVAVLGTGLHSVIIAIAVIDWTRFCRVVRAEAMAQARMDYIDSALVVGRSRAGILGARCCPTSCPPSACC